MKIVHRGILIMKVLLWIVALLYGFLSSVAAIVQISNGGGNVLSSILMIVGGILLITAVFFSFKRKNYSVWLSLAGCILIIISAMWNGIASNSLHISHHVIRFSLSGLLVFGFHK